MARNPPLRKDIQRPMHISQDPGGMFHRSEGPVDGSSDRVSVLDHDGEVLPRFDYRGTGHGSWVDYHGGIYVGLGNPGGGDKFVRQV